MNTDTHLSETNQVDPTAFPPIRATVYVGRWPEIPAVDVPGWSKGTFSPTTSTLISGATEAVLIDAQYLKDDVRDLGDLIERTGKKLTAIYITHGHADHYLGLESLVERFPDARPVALPSVVEAMKQTMEFQARQWAMLFGDATITGTRLPETIAGDALYVDGSPLRVIEVKQADVNPSSIVHVPELDLVVAGDAIYNEIHQMLALSTPQQWKDWLNTVDVVERLHPRMIVAGHRRPDGDDRAVKRMIDQTRTYIKDFASAYETAKTAEELVSTMTAKYPHHGNLWTLQLSASYAMTARDGHT